MKPKHVLLIGGSGFVGRSIANRCYELGVRVTVPTRRRERCKHLFMLPNVSVVQADVNDPEALCALMQGADAVINLVGILHDRDGTAPYGKRFRAAHVDLPVKIVAAMRQCGVRRLVHMSALGASADAPSAYLRSKGAGEAQVLASAGDLQVTVFRPSVIFGPDDAFLNTFAGLLEVFPILPLAGGTARFQPVYVGDVAGAMCASLDAPETFGQAYELCGPKVYTLKELVEYVAAQLGKRRCVFGLSGALARMQAACLGCLPNPPMSSDNLRSMERDSVTDGRHDYPDWHPRALEAVAPSYLSAVKTERRLDNFRSRAGR